MDVGIRSIHDAIGIGVVMFYERLKILETILNCAGILYAELNIRLTMIFFRM